MLLSGYEAHASTQRKTTTAAGRERLVLRPTGLVVLTLVA